MAYSAEESSPIAYITESCCVCDEEFSSDSELTSHLINHANDEFFKTKLQELEKKSVPKNFNKTLTTTPLTTKNTSGREQPLKRTASQRSTSPEVWEIISDDSDDESNKNTKSAKRTSSFRLVSTPKTPENSQNKAAFSASKPLEVPTNKILNNVSTLSKTPLNKSSILSANKPPTNSSNKSSENPSEHGPPYKCPSCTSVFEDTETLRDHLSVHEKPRPFACQICKKTFAQKTTLRQHLHLHIGDKCHECRICHKKFSLKSVLRKHEETHEVQAIQIQKITPQVRTRNQK